ncbi:MAG: glycoside hydrolase family 3 C-terminal domain-containing protein, partial [Pseudomonadota bacterium]
PGRLAACLKHFVGYGAPMGGRDYDAASIAPHELFDAYAEPFRAGVAAGAVSVMAGFHALNGVPMHAHRALIEGWLRGVCGLEGVVVADYTAIRELQAHGIGGRDAVTVQALLAGVDLDMISGDYLACLPRLAETGIADAESGTAASAQEIVAAIEAAAGRVLALKHRLGLFDDPYRGATRAGAAAAPLRPETRALARRAASASAVLLENAGALPLAESGQTIALIGPLADDRSNMLGTWAVSGDPQAAVTIREGLAASANTVLCAKGCNLVEDPAVVDRLNFVPGTVSPDPRAEAEMIAEAVEMAARADVVVAVIGEAKEHSGEAGSRAELDIPAPQRRLFAALRETGKPLVAVVLAGRPLMLGDVAAAADATVLAWFAGTEMGNGLADLLYGRAEPTARLAVSLPAHPGQVPFHHGASETGRPWPGEWRKFTTGYLDLPGEQHPARGLYPFGYGLAYTRFALGAPVVVRAVLAGPEESVAVRVPVENTGARAGTAVVQLYVTDPVARIQRPAQELKGIARLTLAPGAAGEAAFTLTRDDLAYSLPRPDGSVERVWDPGRFILRAGLNARDTASVEVDWRP